MAEEGKQAQELAPILRLPEVERTALAWDQLKRHSRVIHNHVVSYNFFNFLLNLLPYFSLSLFNIWIPGRSILFRLHVVNHLPLTVFGSEGGKRILPAATLDVTVLILKKTLPNLVTFSKNYLATI